MRLYIIYFIYYNVAFIVVVLSPRALCTHADIIREFAVVHTTHVRTYNNIIIIIIIYYIDRCDIHICIYISCGPPGRRLIVRKPSKTIQYNIFAGSPSSRTARTAVSQSPSIYFYGVSPKERPILNRYKSNLFL